MAILKNDIHTLANLKNEQFKSIQNERDDMADMLSNISHQLKTPLTSMMIMADLLDNAPPEKQEEFLSNIKISLVRMDWLVSALLKMAKLDAGAVEFSKKSIHAGTLVDLALKPLQIMLDIKNINIETVCETGLYCDKRWTAEALTNIIKNALEYSPDNSKIYIESGVNPICGWISVTDSGVGISNSEIAALFKRFTGSRSDKGYGIGLPLALAIMRGQSGDIEVDGGGGGGTGKSTGFSISSGMGTGTGSGATFTMKFYK